MSVSLLFRHRQGPPRFLVTFLLSMVLSTLGLSAFAQGHPELKAEDFIVTLLKANLSCNTPAKLRITYANRVPGFTKLTYKYTIEVNDEHGTSTSIPFEHSTTDVGKPLEITLPASTQNGSFSNGQIQVSAEYGGATPETISLYCSEEVGSSTFEQTFLDLQSDEYECPDQIKMPPYPLTGVKELRYKIYKSKDNSLLYSGTNTEPYKEKRFLLPHRGNYRCSVTVVPECANPTKEPTNDYGNGNWDGNNFVGVDQNLYVSTYWYPSVNPYIEMAGCTATGNVSLAIGYSRVDLSSVTYEIRKKGEATVLKSATSTSGSDFDVTIKGLPVGEPLEMTAISDCGSTEPQEFTISSGTWSPRATVFPAYGDCEAEILLETTDADGFTSMTYEIRKVGETAVLKTVAGGATPSFEAKIKLPAGNYELTAVNNCGTLAKYEFNVTTRNSLGNLTVQRVGNANITCPDGVITAQLAGVPNDLTVTYELIEKDSGTLVQTKTAQGETKVTFENIAMPDKNEYYVYYKVNAKTCGLTTSSETYLQSSTNPDLYLRAENRVHIGCSEGEIKALLYGVGNTIDVTYVLSHKGTVLATKSAKGGEEVKFENIFVYEDAGKNDAYTVEAQACLLKRSKEIGLNTTSYPETRIQEQTGPSSICVADGTITVTNYSGEYYFGNLQGQLEVYANDVLIYHENVDKNWTSSTITGVPAGQITAKLNFGCGTTPETKFVLKPRTLYGMNLSVYARMTSYCVDQQMRIEPILEFPRATSGYPPALDMLEEMKQGTYELYKGTTLLSSGNYSDIPEAGLPVTEEGNDYRLVVRSRCTPSVVFTVPNINVKKPVLSFYEARAYDSSGCIPTGGIRIEMREEGRALPANISSLQGYFSYELMKDGVLYRSGQITEAYQRLSITELPPARYTLNVFITCAPEMSISTELEVKGELEVPPASVTIQPACGSLPSDVYISLPRPTSDIKSYDVVLTRKSDNQVVYKNHITDTSIYRQLPAGEYRLTYVMNSQCSYPEATYDFTVGATSDLSEAYNFEVSTTPPKTLNGLGKAQIVLTSKAHYYREKIKDLITLTVTSADGKTYSGTLQAGSSYQFHNLPAGKYTVKASFIGRNCEKTITFLMPSPGLKGYNYPDMECGSNSPLGLGVALETANADFKGKVFTFKLYKRTAPGASTFTQVASKTETAGKTWTYFPGVLSGTDYSLYEAVVEMDGYEVYREKVKKPRGMYLYDLTATSTPTQKYNNVDYKLGTVTAVLPPDANSRYHSNYAMPFGGTHTWELKHNGTGETYTKTASSPLTPVTFDNLPEGNYRIAYSYANGTCEKEEYKYADVTVTSSTPFVLMTSAVNATCELNAKITAEVRDAAGIQMLTYTLTSPANSYNESQNTVTPAVPMTFPGLAPGEYTLRAEAQLTGGGAPLVQTQTITLTGTSPMMNIVIDPKRTRPSFKGCATGYFAFKFADDDEYTPKTIGEEYEFSIVEAPVGSGISVPMKLVRDDSTTLRNPYYTNTNNLSQRMNFPAGKYKFKVKNDCKTLEFEYTLLETDKNPYRYGGLGYRCETDGVYRISSASASINNYDDNYIYWDDLFRLSVTSASGVTMPPAPFSEFAGKVLPFEPQDYTPKVTSICPSIPAVGESWHYVVSYSTRQECDYTEVTGDEGTACEQRILLVEDLDAPVGSQILHRGPFYGYYKAQGNRKFRFTILNQNNKTLWTETMTPKNFGTITWNSSGDKCDIRQVSCYIWHGCGKAYFKIYKGIGAAKEAQPVYESKELETIASYTGPLFQDYTFEAYDHNNVLIYSSTGNSGGYTHITEFGIYNACGSNLTGADDEYEMQKVAFKVPPLDPRTDRYYLPPTTFTIVKGDKTYVGTLHPNYAHKDYYTYWLPAVGEWSYAEVTWKVIRYNTTENVGAHGPKFKFGETISGTYSVCDGPEKPLQGVTQPNKIFNVALLDGWKQTCDGWDLVVPSKAYYTVNDKKQEVTVTGYEYTNPVTKVKYASSTIDGAVLKVPIGQNFDITLKGFPCGFISGYRPNRMEHTIDKAKSLSFYCTANHMGKHYIEAKNGTPPYTYTFYDGTGPTASPIPSTATSPNPQTSMTGAMFDFGEDGKTYRIDVKDACGNVTITHETTVLSMTNLMQRLKQDITTCSGEAVTFLGQSFPVAIYNWTLPAGSPRVLTPAEKSSRILTLNNIQPSDAGTYTLDISPNDCSVNIQMTFELSVDHVAPITTPAVNSIVCKGTPVPLSPGAGSADSNGTPGAVTYQWYHSRDGINFTKITGETTDSYTYPANTVGRMHIKRVDSYKNCSKETPVNVIEVKEAPIQTFTTKELGLSTRNGKKFTLPAGRVVPSTGVTYQWERSDDGVSGWTPVSTDRTFEETTAFPSSKKEVFYRRTVTMGTCSVVSPNIKVRFLSSTPMINPHLRLRVKK